MNPPRSNQSSVHVASSHVLLRLSSAATREAVAGMSAKQSLLTGSHRNFKLNIPVGAVVILQFAEDTNPTLKSFL
jgi:hypothetical protein